MATMHTHPAVQTTIVEHGHRKPSLSHSTDADVLLPNLNTPTHTRRVSGSSFLSSDTEPSPTSSNGATLPPPISSFEISTANTLSLPMPPKPAPPLSNPLMYPGYEHGAPLSDIGEEDTPMSKRTRSRSPSFIESSPVASRSAPIWNQKSERRLSEMSSSSNFSAGSDQWEGFDARVGMSDRLKADLAAAGDDSFNLEGFGSKRNSTNEDEELTTQALSKRAEQILANAKKRLTNMEGNLNKARTSLLISPKGSPTFGEHKQVGVLYRTISEGADRRLAQRPNLKKSRPIFSGTKGGSPLHSRNFSENSLPSKSVRHTKSSEVRSASAMEYGYGGKSIDSVLVERSNGYGNGYSPVSTRSPSSPLTVLKEEGGSPSTNITSPDGSRAHGLGISNHKSHTRNTSNDSGIGLTRSQSQISTRELRDQMNGLRNKIADLGKAQQADKVRRSSLQNIQATSPVIAAEEWYAGAAEYKEGESPLSTNAGMGWRYQNEQESISSTSPISPRSLKSPHPPESPRSPISPRSPSFAEEGGREDHQEGLIPATHVGQDLHSYSNSPNPPPTSKPADGDQDDQDTYIQESHYEDAFDGRSDEVEDTIATSEEEQIFLNEVLEESLQDAEPEIPPIPDIVQSIRPERHEDRADAFDYENFFLHSALGNYSQNGFHRRNISQATVDSRKSYESNESVETTRGPQAEGDGATYEEEAEEDNDVRDRTGDGTFLEDEPPNHAPPPRPPFLQHFRTHSIDSVSSAASFATATEGGNDSGDSDTVPSEILLWGENSLPNTMVGAWPSPPAIMPRSQSSLRNGHTSPLGETNVMQAEELMLRPAGGGALPTPPTSSPLQQDELPPEGEEEEEEDGSEYSEEGIPPHPQQRQPPPNTEILISALITLANPHFKSPGPFDDVDKDLVVNVLRSVGAVCEGINSNGYLKGEVYETKVLRRRLDTARRILSGEIEVEDE